VEGKGHTVESMPHDEAMLPGTGVDGFVINLLPRLAGGHRVDKKNLGHRLPLSFVFSSPIYIARQHTAVTKITKTTLFLRKMQKNMKKNLRHLNKEELTTKALL